MQIVFDETSKTWSAKVSIGQRILDSLMMFKSNIAEVRIISSIDLLNFIILPIKWIES